MKVILADPDRTTRAFIAKALERAGYQLERSERIETVLPRIEKTPSRWSAIVVDSTCFGERLARFAPAARGLGFSARLLGLVGERDRTTELVEGVDGLLHAPGGRSLLHALRRARD